MAPRWVILLICFVLSPASAQQRVTDPKLPQTPAVGQQGDIIPIDAACVFNVLSRWVRNGRVGEAGAAAATVPWGVVYPIQHPS